MDKLQDAVNRASHALLEADIRLRTINAQIHQIDKEIAILIAVEANLEENVRVMKRKRIIVMVNEFRKAKTDLNTARVRQAFLRMDRENVLKVEKHAHTIYNKAKEGYDNAYQRLHAPPNNIIYVDFGRKDGQQI